ncbi:SDR family NAD(P)-dependent oxidoreductase [Flavobacterium sp.]|uniref:SDR family NAD(P)-dependent oxidoreductase n=1 Tax=Flavobacterium sp. TaxID=239 RepID=UPI00286E703A|nr:SDR family NAD(P)-dependent oxidoreductase [Flavobacterium sp.]
MESNTKIALITGANSGIGNALVEKLIAENYFVIGTSRNGKIENINSENLFVVALDLTNQKSIENANSIIRTKFKGIDILINNAGIAPDLDKTAPDLESLRSTFETNVFGLVNFTETILDFVNKNGKILNISSIMATLNTVSKIDSTAYRMSKSALNMYTKTLSARLKDRNINVNSIHPGWVKTKLSTEGAPLSTEFSANGIFKLIETEMETGTFWNAELQEKMLW